MFEPWQGIEISRENKLLWGYGLLFRVQRPWAQHHVCIGTSAVITNIQSFLNNLFLVGLALYVYNICMATVLMTAAWAYLLFFKPEVDNFKFRVRIIFNMNSYKWKPTLPVPQVFCLPLWGGVTAKKWSFFPISLFVISYWYEPDQNSPSSLCWGYFI